MSGARRVAALALAVQIASCVGEPATPPQSFTGGVQLSIFDASDPSLLVAMSKVSSARISFVRDEDTITTVLPVEVHEARAFVRVAVLRPRGEGAITVLAELTAGGGPLFRGVGFISDRAPSSTPIALTPVASQLLITPVSSFDALGDQAQLVATVLFATGDPWVGAEAEWTSSDPSIVAVLQGNVLEARGNGSTDVFAVFTGIIRSTRVTVAQVPAVLFGIAPADTTVASGASFAMRLLGADANGTPLLPGARATWTKTGGVTVDASGTVTATSVGQATVTATSGTLGRTTGLTVVTP